MAYEFRIATTEVTAGQWYEFVQAYAPYYKGSPADSSFTGVSIVPDSSEPSGYRLLAGHENRPTSMSWRFAARYVNWLCNGKATHREAFERGAYDTSTFSQNPDGSYNDPRTRTRGATFWIPTLDEWTKAVYFDPNRYGPGREGYWMHPLGSDSPATPGLPGVGQTSGGVQGAHHFLIDVGSYPQSLTPWGLLDASGGVSEWTETNAGPTNLDFLRYIRGSQGGSSFYDLEDRIDEFYLTTGFVRGAGYGLRIAGIVPNPASGFVLGLACARVLFRRWRRDR